MTTNRRRSAWLVFLGAMLALAGCEQPLPQSTAPPQSGAEAAMLQGGPPPDFPVMIATDASSYAAGAQVTMRLHNQTGRSVSYDLCGSRLDRDDEGSWRLVQDGLEGACIPERRILAPGQAALYSFRAEPRTRRGLYRLRTTLQSPDGRANYTVVSNKFVITREND